MRLGRWGTTVAVFGLALAMLIVGAAVTRGPRQPSEPPLSASGAASRIQVASPSGDLGSAISALQSQLRRVPGDYVSWASLGIAYVQQAAVTGEPDYYPKASGALRRSLRLEPRQNAVALTGLASLAAARHQFARARDYAQQSRKINGYSAPNLGVLSDAWEQLGRYDKAREALGRMLELQPGVSSFTRASYSFELDGDLERAKATLERALSVASRPSDEAFCLYYLGELEWNRGRLDAADSYYARGLAADPSYTQLLAGRAKVAAAQGHTGRALTTYAEVSRRLPIPTYLIAYADLLRSLGRDRAAAAQESTVDVTESLFRGEGVNVGLESALFHADRGEARQAMRAARSMWMVQRSVEAADAYAWALHVAGRDRRALEFARRAARLGTRSALFAFHRGMIESSMGRPGAARSSLRKALRINPHFSPLLASRAHAELGELGGRAAR